MANSKILVAACIRQSPEVLGAYIASLQRLLPPAGTELAFGFVNDDPNREQTLAILNECKPAVVLPAEPRPMDAVYQVGNMTHHWNVATIEHLARQKQRLLNYAVEAGYSYVFMVDSDLLMEPSTLRVLHSAGTDIANAVFWTAWNNEPNAEPLPQCWLSHPYGMDGLGKQMHEFIDGLASRQMLRCLGGGACTLISTNALRKGIRYHPQLEGLPQDGMWQGEDRTLAILAQQAQLRQYADGWPDVYHAYHPQQRDPEYMTNVATMLQAPRQRRVNYGDLVAFTVDPLEDMGMQEAIKRNPCLRSVRCRMGGTSLAPELEAELMDMEVGSNRIVEVKFPYWHAVPEYRNRSILLKLGLVDCKPFGFAPVLAETAYAGLANG